MVSLCVLFSTCTLPAATLSYTGVGGDLNLATTDGVTVTPGITRYLITVNDLYLVNIGDSVTITLNGLQYPFAGDLRATLTLEDNMNNVRRTGDIFNQIGKLSADPNDFGYATQFGNSGAIDSGDYVFDSGFNGVANDLWNTAAGLGSSDSIPSGNYWTTGAFSSANNNLSFQFGGLQTQGTWVLTIYDTYPPFTGIAPYNPGITSWGLAIQASPVGSTPEPSALIPLALCLGVLYRLRRGHNRPL